MRSSEELFFLSFSARPTRLKLLRCVLRDAADMAGLDSDTADAVVLAANEACMNIMTDSHLRHLPVVVDGKLLGLLSIGDLVKEAIAEQAQLISQLEQYIRGD